MVSSIPCPFASQCMLGCHCTFLAIGFSVSLESPITSSMDAKIPLSPAAAASSNCSLLSSLYSYTCTDGFYTFRSFQ